MRAIPTLTFACALVALVTFNGSGQQENKSLVVHEWGTFTSLQDESGAAVGGINTDDEPVPNFVHRVSHMLLLQPTEVPPIFFKGTPACHPEVTMRLETPVLYFHPAQNAPAVSSLNVQVKFNGGWLSEYYPSAAAIAPGLKDNTYETGPLNSATISSLTWDNLEVGGDWPGPKSLAHVWTSPRAVKAANVRTASGEAERFLFYRGVGHINAPLRISSHAGELTFRSQLEGGLAAECPLPVRSLWLVDIRPDGMLAFKTLPALSLDRDSNKILTTVSSQFQSSDYRARNVEVLKQLLQSALVGEGLFVDESQALLDTWELSYFKSAGLRVFFLVPRTWTDTYLPLEISAPAQIQRVMVGRIELVTPAQQEILRQLGKCSFQEMTNGVAQLQKQVYQPSVMNDHWQKINDGKETLNDAQVSVPNPYQLYLRLGRFRQTLVLNEQARHPSENLKAFIATYGLASHGIAELQRAREVRSLTEQAAH